MKVGSKFYGGICLYFLKMTFIFSCFKYCNINFRTLDDDHGGTYESLVTRDNSLIYCCHGNAAEECCNNGVSKSDKTVLNGNKGRLFVSIFYVFIRIFFIIVLFEYIVVT